MKLDYIELENFRQYHGRQRLDFSRDSQRHVTLVHGINGAGKTSLFMAINWCLYGRTVLDNVGELISKKALDETAMGQLAQASVKLAFTHDAQRYVMQRTIGAVRQTDGRVDTDATNNEEVDLRRIAADGQAKKEPNPLSIINAILPANVRTYFLFDGEKGKTPNITTTFDNQSIRAVLEELNLLLNTKNEIKNDTIIFKHLN